MRMVLASSLFATLAALGATHLRPQDPERPPDMAALMARAKQYVTPGPQHELLRRFVGKWRTETRLFSGGNAAAPEAGEAETTWLMEGRWIQTRGKGAFLGQPFESYALLGYDNFKQSYVTTAVSSMDTAMNRAEGDLDPGGKALIVYGTIDEYLTGEHDKMVKIVWRFVSDDEIVMEVHDLPIGEKHTKVVETKYERMR